MKWRKAGEKDERVERKIIKFLVQLRHHLSLVRGTSLLFAGQSTVDVLCLAIARIVRERAPFGTLKGRQLWDLGLNPPAGTAAER